MIAPQATHVAARAGTMGVLACGISARAVLDGARHATVAARFQHSVYLRCAAREFVCIGPVSIGRGPLNVLVDAVCWAGLPLLEPGDRVEIADAAIVLGADARLGYTVVPPWAPVLPRLYLTAPAQQRRVAAFTQQAFVLAPPDWLGWLLAPAGACSLHALARMVLPGLHALEAWLTHAAHGGLRAPAQAIEQLLGLGPGTTPSGDDLLGGVLLGCRALGYDAQADALWRMLDPLAVTRTSELSAAHLGAAASGYAHESLHAVFDTQADAAIDTRTVLAGVGRLGHSSGWDALAGVVLALRAGGADRGPPSW